MDALLNSLPILRSPTAASHLDGLSLTEAFRKFVLNDPEVVALGNDAIAVDKSLAAVFREGQTPGPFVDFRWVLDLTASTLAYRFVSSPIHILGDPLPSASETIIRASEVLVDRLEDLRDILGDGKIVAFGTFAQTGIEGSIARLQWRRSGMSIDVSKGDLCEGEDHRAVPKWTGVHLKLPEAPAQLNGPKDITLNIAGVPRKAEAQIQTKEKCRFECSDWLEAMMSNPEIMVRSIDDLWAEVKQKWPNKVSRRAFLKARDDAIAKTEAWAWKAPGPKPKSLHS